MEKKSKAPFIIACVFTGLALIAQVFAMIYGIPAIRLIFNPGENGEGIALIALLPLFIYLAIAVLIFSIVAIILSIINIAKRNFRTPSIIFVVGNGLFNFVNIVFFILFFTL